MNSASRLLIESLDPPAVTLPCPPEWVTWLQETFIVPGCLTPHGGNDILPEGTESTSMRVFGQGTGAFNARLNCWFLIQEQAQYFKKIRLQRLHTIYFASAAQMQASTGS